MTYSVENKEKSLLLSIVCGFASFCLLLVLSDQVQGEPPANYGDIPKHADRVKTDYENNLTKFKGIPDVLVLPGLIANRKKQRVQILAEATGLTEGTVLDFLLIGPGSNRGYEALAWSHAKPSDIHKSLQFIGMEPGQPFNPTKLRFWSKGERVRLSIGTIESNELLPLENLVINKNTGKPIASEGFIFTGSSMVNKPGNKSQRVYAADFLQPQSITSMFTDSIAVLDVPRRVRLSDVYGTQVVGSEYSFNRNELFSIVIEPDNKDGQRRVHDLVLNIRPSPRVTIPEVRNSNQETTVDNPLANFDFILTNTVGKPVSKQRALANVLGEFDTIIKNGQIPYVSVRFDHAIQLTDVQKICRLIDVIDSESGIRVEPPAAGQLYYRALLPSPMWKDRENRTLQPWELRLHQAGDKISGTLNLIETSSSTNSLEPKVTKFDIDSAESIRKCLESDSDRRRESGSTPVPPILIVFTDGGLRYGQLIDLLSRVQATHNTIHVFLESKHPDRATEKP